MPVYTQEHHRLRNLHPGNTSEFRFPNASYHSTKLSRKWALGNLHRNQWRTTLEKCSYNNQGQQRWTSGYTQTLQQAKALLPDRVHQRKQRTSTYDSTTRSSWQKTVSSAFTKSTLHATLQAFELSTCHVRPCSVCSTLLVSIRARSHGATSLTIIWRMELY